MIYAPLQEKNEKSEKVVVFQLQYWHIKIKIQKLIHQFISQTDFRLLIVVCFFGFFIRSLLLRCFAIMPRRSWARRRVRVSMTKLIHKITKERGFSHSQSIFMHEYFVLPQTSYTVNRFLFKKSICIKIPCTQIFLALARNFKNN